MPEFFGCQSTARSPEFRLGHLQKVMRSFLILATLSAGAQHFQHVIVRYLPFDHIQPYFEVLGRSADY